MTREELEVGLRKALFPFLGGKVNDSLKASIKTAVVQYLMSVVPEREYEVHVTEKYHPAFDISYVRVDKLWRFELERAERIPEEEGNPNE